VFSPGLNSRAVVYGGPEELFSITTSRLKPVTEMGVIFAAWLASARDSASERAKNRRVNIGGYIVQETAIYSIFSNSLKNIVKKQSL
jgi:hypothetical protein